jgi:cysteine desulfurase
MAAVISGGRQEYGKRGGTTNVPGVVGLAEATRLIFEEPNGFADKLRTWTDRFVEGLTQSLPGVALNGHPTDRLPGTANIAFEGTQSSLLVQMLDMSGVCASPGSACQSGAAEPSHVLVAMGLGEERARSSVRFSFGRLNSEDQVDSSIAAVTECVRRFRETVRAGGHYTNGRTDSTASYAG